MRCIAAMLLAFAAFTVRAAPEHSDWGAAVREIGGALQSADFQRLEAMHAKFLEPGARTQDGTWMMEAFQLAFGAFRYQPPGSIEKLFKQWRERAPASTLRPIAEAFAWKERAWLAKGSGCYAQRPSSARKAFNDLIGRAESALRESEVTGQNSPLWHTAAMFVAGAQARPAAELDTLLAESTQRFPAYQPLFVARMTFLLPEWGGDFRAIDAFARASAQHTQEFEGRAMYAWLYVDLARSHCGDLFDQSSVQWADMKAGFEDMLARHPADWNLNLYATFACRARDAETTARILGELGSKASLGIWSGGITTEGCAELVRARASDVMHATDAVNDTVGLWSSISQSRGGIGLQLTLFSDGSLTQTVGAVVDFKYQIHDGKITTVVASGNSLGERGATQSFELKADTLVLDPGTPSEQVMRRSSARIDVPTNVVGEWRYDHYTGGPALLRYSSQNVGQLIVPMATMRGHYELDGTRMNVKLEGQQAMQYDVEVVGDKLTLRDGTGKETAFKRFRY